MSFWQMYLILQMTHLCPHITRDPRGKTQALTHSVLVLFSMRNLWHKAQQHCLNIATPSPFSLLFLPFLLCYFAPLCLKYFRKVACRNKNDCVKSFRETQWMKQCLSILFPKASLK